MNDPPSRTLDLELLRTFEMIARQSTFAAAAQALHKTQSAVTQQMQRLQAQIGCALFVKNGRGRRLTPAGAQLLVYAGRMLALNRQALALLADRQAPPVLRMGSPHDLAENLLTTLLGNFVRAIPQLQMTIAADRSPALMAALANGQLDLTMSTRFDERYPGLRLRSSPTVWLCAHDFHYRRDAPLPLVLPDEPGLFRKIALDALAAADRPWCVRFTAHSLVTVRAAVRAGLGVTARSVEALDGQMRVLGASEGLPPLPDVHYYLYAHPSASSAAARQLFNGMSDGLPRFGPPLLPGPA